MQTVETTTSSPNSTNAVLPAYSYQTKRYRYDIKCDCCGKFIPYSQLQDGGGASHAFVPDSDVSYEEDKYRCNKCTEKHGICHPSQSGMNWDVCCRTF